MSDEQNKITETGEEITITDTEMENAVADKEYIENSSSELSEEDKYTILTLSGRISDLRNKKEDKKSKRVILKEDKKEEDKKTDDDSKKTEKDEDLEDTDETTFEEETSAGKKTKKIKHNGETVADYCVFDKEKYNYAQMAEDIKNGRPVKFDIGQPIDKLPSNMVEVATVPPKVLTMWEKIASGQEPTKAEEAAQLKMLMDLRAEGGFENKWLNEMINEGYGPRKVEQLRGFHPKGKNKDKEQTKAEKEKSKEKDNSKGIELDAKTIEVIKHRQKEGGRQ